MKTKKRNASTEAMLQAIKDMAACGIKFDRTSVKQLRLKVIWKEARCGRSMEEFIDGIPNQVIEDLDDYNGHKVMTRWGTPKRVSGEEEYHISIEF